VADNEYARWFRDSTPYISAHRGKTFVVLVGGDALAHDNLPNIVHDLALLHVTGVRIVLVHGARPQIDEALPESRFHTYGDVTRRVTERAMMPAIIGACAQLRARLEALFSTGLPSTPLHNTDIQLASGNLLVARPIGVLDGIDHGHTGQVRGVYVRAIHAYLDAGSIVLLSPVGYSPSGATYNLAAEEVAERVAVALKAAKLIAFDGEPYLKDLRGRRMTNIKPALLDKALNPATPPQTRSRVLSLVRAVREGVTSGQLIGFADDGALLAELFTANGVGTQVGEHDLRMIRQATAADVRDIAEVIRPLEEAGVLVRRPRSRLEQEVDHFLVAEMDGYVVGCCALYPAGNVAELACVAVHPSHRGSSIGTRLLAQAEELARERGYQELFVLTTQTRDWFIEQGFVQGDINDLPAPRQQLYNYQRNSQILTKTIAAHAEEGQA
jgi:amino-acid N-acetyltransferase